MPSYGKEPVVALHNRVEAGVSPAPPTPPDMRHRIRRFTNVEQDQSDE